MRDNIHLLPLIISINIVAVCSTSPRPPTQEPVTQAPSTRPPTQPPVTQGPSKPPPTGTRPPSNNFAVGMVKHSLHRAST